LITIIVTMNFTFINFLSTKSAAIPSVEAMASKSEVALDELPMNRESNHNGQSGQCVIA
jgi:hypothetical protein